MNDIEENKLNELEAAVEDADLITISKLIREKPSRRDVIRGDEGTWLHIAAYDGKLESVKLLIKLGLNVNIRAGNFDAYPIKLACSGGHYEVVKYLMENGALLDVSTANRNPLFGAIYCGSKETVKFLLDAGIYPRITYKSERLKNMNALNYALDQGKMEIASMIQEFLDKNPSAGR